MKYLGMIIHSIGIVICGIWFCSTLFDASWPDINNVHKAKIKFDTIEETVVNSK